MSIRAKALLFLLSLSAVLAGVARTYAQSDSPEGFASMNALGQNGTTGGQGGTVVTATNTTEFLDYINRTDPYAIYVDGTIILSGMVKVQSHKSILGVADRGVITGGGLNLDEVSNIVIRKLLFENSVDDAINIQDESHHIWVDHCDFTSAFDGLLDIKRGSDYITVSWNIFADHGKTSLLGHSDNNAAQDTTHLRVTYHHNWFNGTATRHPRVRFSALCHVYNNYYLNNSYGIASTMGAEVLVENNYFKNVANPTHVGFGASAEGDLLFRNNTCDGCLNAAEERGEVPEPPYSYSLDQSTDVPAIVQSGAGRVGMPTSVTANENERLPTAYRLLQNYPNPFNPSTTIEFHLPEDSDAILRIYNLSGQLLTTLVDQRLQRGVHRVSFDAPNFASGMYFYFVQAGNFVGGKRMTLVR